MADDVLNEDKEPRYKAWPEKSEFSCDGCDFIRLTKKTINVGTKIKPEYKEVQNGDKGCMAPNIEPFRSCKHDHVIYKKVTRI